MANGRHVSLAALLVAAMLGLGACGDGPASTAPAAGDAEAAYRSADHLGMADADLIVSASYRGRDGEEFLSAFRAIEQVWRSVPTVADGRQHSADQDLWMLGIGPVDARQVRDDLDTTLAD